jgi:two-component system, NtrC family, response regulator AtoC
LPGKRDSGNATTVRHEAPGGVGRFVLLVIGTDGTVAHPLPDTGVVTIGRAEGREVRIDDPSISRAHARLVIGDVVEIEDLGSTNGVRIAGQALAAGERRAIAADEVVALGEYKLIVQQRVANARPQRLWSNDYFEVRLEDECARAARFGWTFALVHLRLEREVSPAVTRECLGAVLRAADVLGAYGPGEYEVILVDVQPAQAEQIAARMADALEHRDLGVHLDVACYPRDGRDPERLAARVRATARGDAAEPGWQAPLVISASMRRLHEEIARVAGGEITVLLLGETGTGKEVIAETIHRASPRAAGPFLRLNCAALQQTLLESELFGHERGAFTGATAAKPGLLETAQGGTVFLDEIGELATATQSVLLRVLEERKVLRVGGLEYRAIDVRFIAATNRELEGEVARGRFREDLFYRLSGAILALPPLRERADEIEPLARRFIAEASARGRRPPGISPEALALLQRYVWPGNLRELRNAIERAVLLCDAEIGLEHLPVEKMEATVARPSAAPASTPAATPAESPDDDAEAERIRAALERAGGNQTMAARELGMSRRTLVNRLNEYGLPRPRKGR